MPFCTKIITKINSGEKILIDEWNGIVDNIPLTDEPAILNL